MVFGLQFLKTALPLPGYFLALCSQWRRVVSTCLLALVVTVGCLLLLMPPALAGINDDNFDGNIFALYGGNGSLVPPKVTLADSLQRGKPAFLVFYVDDSSDCKQYANIVSNLQSFYGQAADFIPINADAIFPKSTYEPTEPGYYFSGAVPQTVLLDQSGKVVLNVTGKVPFEQVDDIFRKLFNLPPRSQSVEFKQRSFNEFNSELSK